MAIIGTLPNNIQDGQVADATPVMADFNYIVSQVNANAAPLGTLTAPSGTGLTFFQASAPVGWVAQASITDHTIQVTTVGGGSSVGPGYSTMFQNQWTTDGHALVLAELAAHNHGIVDPGHNHAMNDPGHAHTINGENITGGGSVTMNGASNPASTATQPAFTGVSTVVNTTGISTSNAGSGTAHSHTKTFGVQFITMILAIKS